MLNTAYAHRRKRVKLYNCRALLSATHYVGARAKARAHPKYAERDRKVLLIFMLKIFII